MVFVQKVVTLRAETEAVVMATSSGNLRGALWMLASALAFSVSMTLVKFMGHGYPAAMQVFIRQLVGLLVLVPFIMRDPVAAFAMSRIGLFVGRAIATSLSMVLSFTSYQQLPLAEANALSFTRTLWMVPPVLTWVGVAIIVGAAVFITWHSHRERMDDVIA